ncbi:antiviral reverse transcriptase Drt3b [Agrobacterium rosae]|uniref:antiviral reverse transcriptase Drt3b n=1 Tax=Agrobacterium rosae TaxID=1972867 RepID=UPI003B9E25DD
MTFGNHKLLTFIAEYDVSIDPSGPHVAVSWNAEDDSIDQIIFLLFGSPENGVQSATTQFRGRSRTYRTMDVHHHRFETLPFKFRIAHKDAEARELSVIHPRNQLAVSHFYEKHAAAIIYSTSKSEFSIRRPVAVAKAVYFKDKTHYDRLDTGEVSVEESDKEYELSGSYFVYKDYSNIHRFFESAQYHRSERKFSKMLKLDISKCFDSVYTHTLPWAVIGKERTKDNLPLSKGTYAGKFDALMQKMNRNETNGIIIGSEFSRIFAEVILQSVDVSVENRLRKKGIEHKTDYYLYRYVDDYFLFYERPEVAAGVLEVLGPELREVKLNLNTAKTMHYQRPIITEITIAKSKITTILDNDLSFDLADVPPDADGRVGKAGNISINATRTITRLKSALKEAGVEYGEVLNYTLAVIDRRTQGIVKRFFTVDDTLKSRQSLVSALIAIVEISFFIYSGAPKVNHTIKLCRVLSIIIESMNNTYFDSDEKHSVFKIIFDCAHSSLKASKSNDYQQVETIYLLNLVKELGREYWLDSEVLCDYFGIRKVSGVLQPTHQLNYLAITSLLQYVDEKRRYDELRVFLESATLSLLDSRKFHLERDTESLLLVLDFVSCPYVSSISKDAALSKFGLSPVAVSQVQDASNGWFTTWRGFRFGEALDRKRFREVY